jgi:hypothetical protein
MHSLISNINNNQRKRQDEIEVALLPTNIFAPIISFRGIHNQDRD